MADETTDIINKEQFVICIRWVDNDLNANEDFIGLHELSVTNAETLAFILKDVVLRLRLDLERLRGKCYGGCGAMMGKVSGVAATIKNELNKDALAIHCHARALGLQWLTGCLGLALVFVWNGAQQEGFNFCFSRFFC